ncbi:MAG: T9SS type A sorting domain-containing protein [Flavobacteriales bacterium]|nr:T9SS type A sorting domain-containing protein [Flavobacteriales bacterium]
MRYIGLFITLVLCTSVFAQEELIDLKYNPSIYKESQFEQRRYEGLDITYLIDTLELPFLDDFSSVKLHRYGNTGELSFLDTTYAKYRMDGELFDTVYLNVDTTYSFYYSVVTGTVDTLPNEPFTIEEFNPDSTNSWVIGTFWTNNNYYYSNGILIDTVQLTHDSIFINELKPIYIAYDSASLWINNDVFINNTFHIGAPTIGVATFDGIDSLGHAYDLSQDNSYGIGDYLTSKPINLEGKTDVLLSFYYQQEGLGNRPEEEDSLVLEFYIPDSAAGVHVWSVSGDTSVAQGVVPDFQFVSISVSGDRLAKGFKFRFKNYGTLSGSLDQWNIDYVYLNENRVTASEITADLGFKSIDMGLVAIYSSMPWHQYLANTTKYTKTDFDFTVTNRSSTDLSGENTYQVIDLKDNTEIFSSTISLGFFPNFTAQTTSDENFPINSSPYSFTFPSDGDAEKNFEIVYATHSNTIAAQEQNFDNDTVRYKQVFSSYYSYDDGTPERAYTLIGAGSQLAYGFELEEADTIQSLLIHFPEMFVFSDNSIKVMIWNEANGKPNDTLYVGYPRDTLYVGDTIPVRFMRFYIDRQTIIPAGKFFIGFEQSLNDKMYIGFDMNLESQSNLYYNVDGTWEPTSFTGSLMMRPDFGKADIPQIYSTQVNENKFENDILIYPNPANSSVTIRGAENASLQLINVTGQIVYAENNLSYESTIDVSDLERGIYFVRVSGTNRGTEDYKLIVTR